MLTDKIVIPEQQVRQIVQQMNQMKNAGSDQQLLERYIHQVLRRLIRQ
jgi:hypothetical protein